MALALAMRVSAVASNQRGVWLAFILMNIWGVKGYLVEMARSRHRGQGLQVTSQLGSQAQDG